jgi:uncharacterized repeat protein (TIGR01451 family)
MSLFGKIILAVGVLLSFYVGYAGSAQAWPGVPDRDRWYGYFKNQRQTFGDDVLVGGIPAYVDTGDEFIAFIEGKLAAGPGSANGVGAAFIIQTMIGLSRNLPPTAAEVKEWEDRVHYNEFTGRITWHSWSSYTVNSYYQPGPVDDAFYYENGTSDNVAFRNPDGSVAYMLRRECANPVGNLAPIPDTNYTLTGQTTVNKATAFPGDSVTYTHTIHNAGPDPATTNWASRVSPTNTNLATGSTTINSGGNFVRNENFTIPANAPFGETFCRYIYFSPATNGFGQGQSVPACVQVVADFETIPTVVPSATTAQQNDSITFTYRIQITGNTRSTGMACRIVGSNQPPGYTPLPQQDVDKNPPLVPQPTTNCLVEFPKNSTTVIATETTNVGNLSPGSRVCRTLVINPREETGGFRSSAEACVVIAKTPYVHFMGNDVWAGGGFQAVNPACNTSAKIQTIGRTLQDTTVAGSAVEYGAFALNKITNFGSANKGLVDPAGVAGKVLTFSNFDNNNLGFYGASQHCINDYVEKYSSTPVTAEPIAVNVAGKGSGTWHFTGAHQFSGAVPAGVQQVYLVEGDVTITNNLQYPASYGSVSDIPSLIVIATGNITVQSGVQQMDGLFVTRGIFATCDPAPGNLSVSICANQLVVNGSVIANQINLLRTHGADGSDDTARKVPAEVFNFNAEMYMRSALNGTNGTILRTVDQKDLPPRF